MSMYNLVHGVNPLAGVLLRALNLESQQIPRFRDAWWDGRYICVYTRTGGGNREYWDAPNDDNMEGPWNSDLRAIEGYVKDEDDSYDSTYATFYYQPFGRAARAAEADPHLGLNARTALEELFGATLKWCA